MKRFFLLALAFASQCASPAVAQIVSSPAQQVQGTPAVNRGYPVKVQITDGSGNAITSEVPTGPAGTPATDVITVQGIAGGTAQPISAASLPLPTGASTSAAQTTANTSLTTINTTLGTPFQAGGSIGNTTFAATQSGTWNVTNVSGTISLPTGASTSALQTSGNTLLGAVTETAPASDTASSGLNGRLQRIAQNLTTMNATALPAGSALIGKVGIDQTTPGTTNAVVERAAYTAAAALAPYHFVSAANTNGQNIFGTAHMLYSVIVSNNHVTNWAYVKFYNKATSPTVGTDTPTIVVPCGPGQTVVYSGNGIGIAFSTGISVGVSGGITDADTTATAANQVIVTVLTNF